MKNLLALTLFMCVSCSPLRHWKAVATDTRITEEKKAIIAPMVALEFPVQSHYVKGEDIIRIDTAYKFIRDLDTLDRVSVDTVTVTIRKFIRSVDTLYQMDEATRLRMAQELAQSYAEGVTLRVQKEAAESALNALKSKERKLWGAIVTLSVVLIGLIYLRFRGIL